MEDIIMIAEAGVLPFGRKDIGIEFVNKAVEVGVKYLKFQCITVSNVVDKTIDPYWYNRLSERALSKEDFIEIMRYGRGKGIEVFASTHNEYDMLDLSDAGMNILKIGSGDSNNYKMIDMCLDTGKTVILSLGMLNYHEIMKILNMYRGCSTLIPMWCVSMYPTPFELCNLNILNSGVFSGYRFGYSDHTVGTHMIMSVASIRYLYAIEKHVCLNMHKNVEYDSMDMKVALTMDEFGELLSKVNDIRRAFTEPHYDSQVFEHRSWAFKSVIASKDICAGKAIDIGDLTSIRPFIKELGHISVSEIYNIVGCIATKELRKGEHITMESICR